jgi:hypothetical protein
MLKNLTAPVFRPLLWMVPGFAFTVFAYWYPTWVDRRIPEQDDSRIWMIVGILLSDTFWASLTVTAAFAFLLRIAFRDRNRWAVAAIVFGVPMLVPSAWLAGTIVIAWVRSMN